MSEPNTIEFGVLKMGDGADPEGFTSICGLNTTGFNRTVESTDRYIRDCTAPATPPNRRVKVTGRKWDLTGSGYFNMGQQADIEAAIGVKKSWQFVVMDDDGTTPLGTWAGSGVMTAANIATSENDLGTLELTIASDGAWTYTAAS